MTRPAWLLSTPPESAWAADSSHRHLPAHCPSWGRGGHRGSLPGAGRGWGETEKASLMLAASSGKASLKSRLVPRWKDQIEEHDSYDTCRKEWFSEHPSRGLSPRAAEGPALLREKVVPGGRTPSSSSADQFTGFGGLSVQGAKTQHRQPEESAGFREQCYCGICTCGLWRSHGSLLSPAARYLE